MLPASNVNIRNRRASFDYEILDRYTAGIVLYGTEIKSIRASRASLADTYCLFVNNELWVKNMHIATYAFGSFNNHETKRDRKLLLNRKELNRLQRDTLQTGNTIVPLRLYIAENGLAKMEIALVRGKKAYDKRNSLKEKDDRRNIDRLLKEQKS